MAWENIYKNKHQLNRYPYTEIVSFFFRNRSMLHSVEHGFKAFDVGCGSGIHSAFLAEQGGEVLGIDFSASAVEHATKTYGSDRVQFAVADFGNYTPQNGPYHLVVDRLSTTHSSIPITTEFYQRLKSQLQPGAKLLWQGFSDDNSACALAQTQGDGYLSDFTGSVFQALGQAAFFSEAQVRRVFDGYKIDRLRKVSDYDLNDRTDHTSWIAEVSYDSDL
jgi:2-polyprenyl-3-methyl-5-hydroxy-6-metoxy-1,4-benzoquinol methylase